MFFIDAWDVMGEGVLVELFFLSQMELSLSVSELVSLLVGYIPRRALLFVKLVLVYFDAHMYKHVR